MTMPRDQLRWNGWGRLGQSIGFGPQREAHLLGELGRRLGRALARATDPVTLEDVRLPPPKLAADVLAQLRAVCGADGVRTGLLERVTHALGKSLPDLLRLRSGELDVAPDAVVYPADEGAVVALLRIAREARLAVVPFGGGTSVVGGVDARFGPDHSGVITLDTTGLDQLVSFDATSGTATFQAGIDGPALEAALAARGRTLGHFPQSFEQSTLGGWIAVRSSGQQSSAHGGIEEMLVAVRVVTPEGVLRTIAVPRSAAGPDLNALILGSEGTLGVIVEATLRTVLRPDVFDVRGMLFRDFASGVRAARAIAQEGVALSMLRLSDPDETRLFELLRAHPGRGLDAAALALRAVARFGYAEGRCALLYGVEGTSRMRTALAAARVRKTLRAHGGLPLGRSPGRAWLRDRFRTPLLRDWLLDHGVAVDTMETALPWSSLERGHAAIVNALQRSLVAHAGSGLAMAHLSHVYADGASLYFTILYPLDPHNALAQWQAIKRDATDAIVGAGGTLSHHHGVGRDHAAWLAAEKGALGLRSLRALKREVDPSGVMNPGKLL